MSRNIRSREFTIPETQYDYGVAAQVPYQYLWGTQAPHEYSTSKSGKIKKAYQRHGYQLLLDNPTFGAFYSNHDSSLIFIVDGHHRIREAPNQDIFAIPTWIFTTAFLAEIFNEDLEEYEETLHIGSDRALRGFDLEITASGKVYLPPLSIRGITSFSEFKQMIMSPNQFGIFTLPLLKHLSTK